MLTFRPSVYFCLQGGFPFNVNPFFYSVSEDCQSLTCHMVSDFDTVVNVFTWNATNLIWKDGYRLRSTELISFLITLVNLNTASNPAKYSSKQQLHRILVLLDFNIYRLLENPHPSLHKQDLVYSSDGKLSPEDFLPSTEGFSACANSLGSQLCQSDYEYRISLQSCEVKYTMATSLPQSH